MTSSANAPRTTRRADPALESGTEPQELLPRRRPTQERSRRKFEALLSASRELLVDVGFESFTCEEVASRADVPIGTLYQFFANKYVIVCELDRQDLVGVQHELAQFDGEIPSLDWLRFLNTFVDHLAGLWTTDPSRREVWLAMQSTPSTRATGAIHERALAEQITRMLTPLTPDTPPERRHTMAQVLVHVVYSMLGFSVQGDQTREDAVAELKRLMGAYLSVAEKESRMQHRRAARAGERERPRRL
ncbi:TetR/AcrR family transcriptional regulator [Rhodococcus rhodnii]|uniref:TetR family transcriptional regulator n=2 Tax=Rhodococcus rhodnii TaxID=38312 RepID=R7WIU5_9NOCA|nr:TetR/AcrR family transcriptional regulator [Rhodococcus rhodnii]EOM75167.1 TetR family transcriptional regulator [Rhodococcus rhodnii LMG 5362]TXG91600.1 TetR/AcrR family transcriptional regulator [Rhodococcus rhodnii]